jgi:hypothetical protein
MAMGCDANNWRICFLQAIARFTIVDGAQHKRQGPTDNSMFPQMKHLAAASTSVTRYLQDSLDSTSRWGKMEDYWPNLHAHIDPGVVSTSIRRGGIRRMKRNRHIRKEERYYRSGHKDTSRAEEYDEIEAVDTLHGMKVLNGSHDIFGPSFLPSLRAVSREDNKVLLHNFSCILFGPGLPQDVKDDPKLLGILELLLASTLMYYDDWN